VEDEADVDAEHGLIGRLGRGSEKREQGQCEQSGAHVDQ
jgi:hypothetical protein